MYHSEAISDVHSKNDSCWIYFVDNVLVVKKICGWTDEKVMTRYIRLAGIDVAGATEGLTFIRPVVEDQQLVNLSNFRMNRKDPSTND